MHLSQKYSHPVTLVCVCLRSRHISLCMSLLLQCVLRCPVRAPCMRAEGGTAESPVASASARTSWRSDSNAAWCKHRELSNPLLMSAAGGVCRHGQTKRSTWDAEARMRIWTVLTALGKAAKTASRFRQHPQAHTRPRKGVNAEGVSPCIYI